MQQHICAVQVLLLQKFPKRTGLQDTLDLANMRWNSHPNNLMQKINISNSQWVCVSNINSAPTVVDICDSVYPSPPCILKEQYIICHSLVTQKEDHFTNGKHAASKWRRQLWPVCYFSCSELVSWQRSRCSPQEPVIDEKAPC